jgi:hypothetical protein
VLGLFQGFVNIQLLAIMGRVDGAPEALRGQSPENWQRTLNAAAELGLLSALVDGYYTMHPALPWFIQ